MSYDLNRVDVIGRLTRDLEMKYTSGGTAVANMSIAVGGRPKPDGTDTVSFFEVVVWGKTAEVCSQYLAKGKQIAVMGHIEQQRWQDKDSGKTRSKVQIVAERVQFLGGGKKDGQAADNQPEAAEGAGQTPGDDSDYNPSDFGGEPEKDPNF